MTSPPTIRARALDAAAQALNAGGYLLPTTAQAAVVDAVIAVTNQPAERCGDLTPGLTGGWLECVLRPGHHGSHADHGNTRWTEKPQGRLDAARAWARTNLPAEQQEQLLTILGGREARA
ncbi:hypothetical protein [Streptomyces sp. NPDC001389]|uniref:hypothetical protein n=1 Tax=Streptomyces sp. NPDC001389 TaxID=3364569 RepID=UPI00367B4E6C